MGSSYSTKIGYGLLVLGDDALERADEDMPEGVTDELVGDFVLGEDCGVFYVVDKSGVSVTLDSEVSFDVEYISEYVTEYSDYRLGTISPEIRAWFSKVDGETEGTCKLGVFKVGYYG